MIRDFRSLFATSLATSPMRALSRPLSFSHLLLAPAFHRSSRPLSALQPPPFPRAAVAVTLMRETTPRTYLLVQRSKPPNVGSWSLPGGKIELGETTLAAGARELEEETALGASDGVRLHPDSIGSSDAIVPDGSGGLQFHYVITQLFAFCTDATATARSGDDAAAVRWVTLAEAEDGSINLGGNVCAVLRRAEQLLACGALQLSADATSMTYPTREP
jgi:8-oxo-dGTP diphosphatase